MARAPSPTRETRVLPRIRVVLNDWNDPPPLRYGAASSRRRCGGRCLGLVGDQLAQERNEHNADQNRRLSSRCLMRARLHHLDGARKTPAVGRLRRKLKLEIV
jgi:hypothetical protein